MKLRVTLSSCEQLLPGIPDDITFGEIIPKLPWRAFYVLSSVSHLWRNTIQSRKIYDARVRSNSTEMLIVIQHKISDWAIALALYSLRDQAFYQLPGILSFHDGRIPHASKFVSLNGKIYVLGGFHREGELYELDLARQRQWKRCASMLRPPFKEFVCGIMDGKIYLFSNPVSAVYDPKENAWSYIKPMLSLHKSYSVIIKPMLSLHESYSAITMGEEVVVHGGFGAYPHLAKTLEIYHPMKDEWRAAGPFVVNPFKQTLFVAQGKLYVMCDWAIFVIDMGDFSRKFKFQHSNLGAGLGDLSWARLSWRHRHSNSPEVCPLSDYLVNPCAIVAVNEELLATLQWCNRETSDSDSETTSHKEYIRSYLFQSNGFGSENEEIVWQKVQCPLYCPTLMCSIQL